jgi:hypothetical protein
VDRDVALAGLGLLLEGFQGGFVDCGCWWAGSCWLGRLMGGDGVVAGRRWEGGRLLELELGLRVGA